MPWQSELLTSLPGIRHGLTRRVPSMGQADGNIGFSAPRDKADAWEMRQRWAAAGGFNAERLVTLGQVHGNEILPVVAADAGRGARPGSSQIGLGDALVTDAAGPVLMTLHADCQPLLFVDPARNGRGPVVAVAHAGWRGTVADVAGQAITMMTEVFSSRPQDVHVYLGPAIDSCCYEVGDEVIAAWRQRSGSDAEVALARHDVSVHFSLSAANGWLLRQAGVLAQHMEFGSVCTRCGGENWFSHRGQGAATGRFGAMIAIAQDRNY
jgi:polyphenol oxidase